MTKQGITETLYSRRQQIISGKVEARRVFHDEGSGREEYREGGSPASKRRVSATAVPSRALMI